MHPRANHTTGVIALTLALYYLSLYVYGRFASDDFNDLHVLHGSAVALLNGLDIYWAGPATWDGARNLNPPHVIALMAPLGWLSVQATAVLMFAGMALAIATTYAAAARVYSPHSSPRALLLVALMVASGPSTAAITLINFGWFLAAGTAWAWVWTRDRLTKRAAVALGVMASVKVFFFLFVPYWIWRRDWGSLRWFSVTCGGIFALGLVTLGLQRYLTWVEILRYRTPLPYGGNRHFDAAIHALVTRLKLQTDAQFMLGAVAALVVLAVAWWRLRRDSDVDRDWAIVLSIMLIVSPLGWVYYWLIPALPVARVLLTHGPAWGRTAAIAGFMLPPYVVGLFVALGPEPLKPVVASTFGLFALVTFAALIDHNLSTTTVRLRR